MVKKLKPILPSLREKKRYVAFEAIGKPLDFPAANASIQNSVQKLLGTLGSAKAGIMVLENKYHSNKGLVKVSHKYVDALKASFVLSNENGVIFKSLGVSGILKKAEEKYLKD